MSDQQRLLNIEDDVSIILTLEQFENLVKSINDAHSKIIENNNNAESDGEVMNTVTINLFKAAQTEEDIERFSKGQAIMELFKSGTAQEGGLTIEQAIRIVDLIQGRAF